MLTDLSTQDALMSRADEMDLIPGATTKTESHHETMLEVASSYDTAQIVNDDQAPSLVAQRVEKSIDSIALH